MVRRAQDGGEDQRIKEGGLDYVYGSAAEEVIRTQTSCAPAPATTQCNAWIMQGARPADREEARAPSDVEW